MRIRSWDLWKFLASVMFASSYLGMNLTEGAHFEVEERKRLCANWTRVDRGLLGTEDLFASKAGLCFK